MKLGSWFKSLSRSADAGTTGQPAALDFSEPGIVHDPYPALADLRRAEPIHRSRSGAWVLTRHADVQAALSDPRLSNRPSKRAVTAARNKDKYLSAEVASNLIAFQDRPQHTAVRRRLSVLFQQAVKAQEASLDATVGSQVDVFLRQLEQQPGDLLSGCATPLARTLAQQLFPLQLDNMSGADAWTDSFFYLFSFIPSADVLVRVERDLQQFRAAMIAAVQRCRANPENNLLSACANDAELTELLSIEALADNLMLLYADAIENVDSGLANAMAVLLADEQARSGLVRGTLLPEAVLEECLRFEPAAQFIGRVVAEEMEFAGQRFPQHAVLLLHLAAANRDEQLFDNPDCFRPGRDCAGVVSFGRGPHNCIGSSLVRGTLLALLVSPLPAATRLRGAYADLQWQNRPGHRWLRELPVVRRD